MSDNQGKPKPVPEILLEVLACPKCKSRVEIVDINNEDQGLKCTSCRIVYPVRNGIPIMLESESVKLDGE